MGAAGLARLPLAGARLELRVLQDDRDGRWDRFVAETTDATFCHLWGWREVLAGTLGHDCLYLAAVDEEGSYRGILPLVRVKSLPFGDYVVSMPFLNYGGPVGTPDARLVLEHEARAHAERFAAGLLELRSRSHEAVVLETSRRKLTVLLDLPEAPGDLWRRFPSKLRSQVGRAEKAGLITRFGPEQRDAFYSVLARNMRDLGTPVMPAAWFENIARAFPDLVEFGVVYQGRVPVAAGCGFLHRNEFEMTWASSLREHNRLAGNMLLYWSFMQRMIERGARVFNFGRCTPGGGTHRFKQQWGGRDLSLPWGQWSTRAIHATPSPDAGKYGLAVALWQRLPLPVANRLGPMLARVIP